MEYLGLIKIIKVFLWFVIFFDSIKVNKEDMVSEIFLKKVKGKFVF